MTLGHGKKQAQAQEQEHEEKAGEKAKTGHPANAQLTHAADISEAAKLALKGVRERAAKWNDPGNDLREHLDRARREHMAAQDAFDAAQPNRAAQSIDQAQQHARAEMQAREWQDQIQRVQASLTEAMKAVSHAAASIATRHDAAEQLLRKELNEKAATARAADVSQGLTADEVTKRQQGRDEVIESQMTALAKRHSADGSRVTALEKEIHDAAVSMVQSQAKLADRTDLSHGEPLAAGRDLLERFEESWRASLAMKLLFDGCFSDIEAVQKTWQQAAAGQSNDAKGFANAREKFWQLVNAQASKEAIETHRLLSLAGVEWGKGSDAPLLDMHSESVDQIRELANVGDTQAHRWARAMDRNTRLSIDHVADKGTNPALTHLAANLRFTTHADNSARGASYGVNDRLKADFERSQSEQDHNAQRRDDRRAQTADRSHDELRDKEFVLAPERLRQRQHRARTAHDKELLAAKDRHDFKLSELRDAQLGHLDGESEDARRARQQSLLDVLEKFHQSRHAQLAALQTYERAVHERQQQDLRAALEAVDAAATRTDVAQQLLSITTRLVQEHRAVEGVWDEMGRQQHRSEALLMQAIYDASNRTAQEEQIKQALAEQETTRVYLQARLNDLKRNAQMDD